MTEKPKILIAVPAYPGIVRLECANSLFELATWLCRKNIGSLLLTLNLNDIVYARNCAASIGADRTDITHVLFVDSDMWFRPSLIEKMLLASVPIIGCASPRRTKDEKLEFTLAFERDSDRSKSPCKVARVGTGIMLIETTTLRAMVATNSLRQQKKHTFRGDWSGTLYGFFDRIEKDDGGFLGEDFSFCDRWRKQGGEMFAILDEEIGHYDGWLKVGRYQKS